jgi:hypothetical protein
MPYTVTVPNNQTMSFAYSWAGGSAPIAVTLAQSQLDGTSISSNTQVVTPDDPLPEEPDALIVFNFSGGPIVVSVSAMMNSEKEVECKVTSVTPNGNQVTVVQFGVDSAPNLSVLVVTQCQVVPAMSEERR